MELTSAEIEAARSHLQEITQERAPTSLVHALLTMRFRTDTPWCVSTATKDGETTWHVVVIASAGVVDVSARVRDGGWGDKDGEVTRARVIPPSSLAHVDFSLGQPWGRQGDQSVDVRPTWTFNVRDTDPIVFDLEKIRDAGTAQTEAFVADLLDLLADDAADRASA